ncbi:MAG: glycosyltransferase family 39 protein [Candidatus Aminicenantes bacterium]|nr:glycosyltransferase family 39 protein [Candidatus Aminicenantes bacterium]
MDLKPEAPTASNARRAVWARRLALALLLIGAALLRLQHIKADPPLIMPQISGSAGIYFDEGIYSHNARNKVLFGKWITDEWNPMVYNAPLTMIYYLGFQIFGISIVTVKAINILFGLLGIFLFHAGLRCYLRPGQALALTCLFAFDFYSLMYSRIGLLENFSAFGFLLGFYLFMRPEEERWPLFCLGLTAAVAALSKYLFAYFLISTLLAVAYRAWRRADPRTFVVFLAGVLTAALPWFFGIYLPFRSTFSKIGSGWGMLSLPRSLAQALANLWHNPLPRYLQLMPVAGLLFVLFGAWALLKIVRARSYGRACGHGHAVDLDLFVFFWIIGAMLTMGLLNYRPLRYYLPLLPAVYLAVSLLLRDREWIASQHRLFWPLALVPAGLFFPFFHSQAVGNPFFRVFPLALRLLIIPAAAAIMIYFTSARAVWRRSAAVFVFAVMLAGSLFLYDSQFYRRPSFRLEAASRFMATLPAGSVVLGQEAPRLTLGTNLRAVLSYENWFNDRDPFRRYAPDYVLALDRFNDAELGWIKRRFPDVAAHFRLLRAFPVWDTTVSLYQVK